MPNDVPEKETRYKNNYEIFDFRGKFMHESRHMSATPQLMEVLGEEGDVSPQRIMITCRAVDAQEVFTAFVELKLISIKDHYYERTDDESEKRNRKDAKKNEKFLGHLPQHPKKRKRKPQRTNKPVLDKPIDKFA